MAQKENKISWLLVVIIFLLGISLAANVFLFRDIQDNKAKLSSLDNDLKNEVDKLKKDDLALAQAFNNLSAQLQALGIIKTAEPKQPPQP